MCVWLKWSIYVQCLKEIADYVLYLRHEQVSFFEREKLKLYKSRGPSDNYKNCFKNNRNVLRFLHFQEL
jgi:hypothetical protein